MSQLPPINQPSSEVGLKSRYVTIGLYVVAAFFYWVSLYLYVPTLPTYVHAKIKSLAQVGTVLSMYGLWQAIVRLPLGIAVDWLGRRKPFIILGLILAGLGAWLMGSANDYTGLIVGRSVTGLAAAAWVPMVVAFSGLYPIEETVRATTLLTFSNSTGRVLATGFTGTLNNWGGYTFPFFLASGAAGLGILFILLTREERLHRQLPSFNGIAHLIFRKEVLLPSLLTAVAQYANWTSTFGFSPILAQQLGATDVTQSMIVTVQLVMTVIGNLSAKLFVNRVGERRMIIFSFFLLAIGVGMTAIASWLPMLFFAQFFIGLSIGINYPLLTGLNIRYVKDAERNTAMGLFQSVHGLGIFAGPWLSGLLSQAMGLRPMLFVTAISTLILGLSGGLKLRGKT